MNIPNIPLKAFWDVSHKGDGNKGQIYIHDEAKPGKFSLWRANYHTTFKCFNNVDMDSQHRENFRVRKAFANSFLDEGKNVSTDLQKEIRERLGLEGDNAFTAQNCAKLERSEIKDIMEKVTDRGWLSAIFASAPRDENSHARTEAADMLKKILDDPAEGLVRNGLPDLQKAAEDMALSRAYEKLRKGMSLNDNGGEPYARLTVGKLKEVLKEEYRAASEILSGTYGKVLSQSMNMSQSQSMGEIRKCVKELYDLIGVFDCKTEGEFDLALEIATKAKKTAGFLGETTEGDSGRAGARRSFYQILASMLGKQIDKSIFSHINHEDWLRPEIKIRELFRSPDVARIHDYSVDQNVNQNNENPNNEIQNNENPNNENPNNEIQHNENPNNVILNNENPNNENPNNGIQGNEIPANEIRNNGIQGNEIPNNGIQGNEIHENEVQENRIVDENAKTINDVNVLVQMFKRDESEASKLLTAMRTGDDSDYVIDPPDSPQMSEDVSRILHKTALARAFEKLYAQMTQEGAQPIDVGRLKAVLKKEYESARSNLLGKLEEIMSDENTRAEYVNLLGAFGCKTPEELDLAVQIIKGDWRMAEGSVSSLSLKVSRELVKGGGNRRFFGNALQTLANENGIVIPENPHGDEEGVWVDHGIRMAFNEFRKADDDNRVVSTADDLVSLVSEETLAEMIEGGSSVVIDKGDIPKNEQVAKTVGGIALARAYEKLHAQMILGYDKPTIKKLKEIIRKEYASAAKELGERLTPLVSGDDEHHYGDLLGVFGCRTPEELDLAVKIISGEGNAIKDSQTLKSCRQKLKAPGQSSEGRQAVLREMVREIARDNGIRVDDLDFSTSQGLSQGIRRVFDGMSAKVDRSYDAAGLSQLFEGEPSKVEVLLMEKYGKTDGSEKEKVLRGIALSRVYDDLRKKADNNKQTFSLDGLMMKVQAEYNAVKAWLGDVADKLIAMAREELGKGVNDSMSDQEFLCGLRKCMFNEDVGMQSVPSGAEARREIRTAFVKIRPPKPPEYPNTLPNSELGLDHAMKLCTERRSVGMGTEAGNTLTTLLKTDKNYINEENFKNMPVVPVLIDIAVARTRDALYAKKKPISGPQMGKALLTAYEKSWTDFGFPLARYVLDEKNGGVYGNLLGCFGCRNAEELEQAVKVISKLQTEKSCFKGTKDSKWKDIDALYKELVPNGGPNADDATKLCSIRKVFKDKVKEAKNA